MKWIAWSLALGHRYREDTTNWIGNNIIYGTLYLRLNE